MITLIVATVNPIAPPITNPGPAETPNPSAPTPAPTAPKAIVEDATKQTLSSVLIFFCENPLAVAAKGQQHIHGDSSW